MFLRGYPDSIPGDQLSLTRATSLTDVSETCVVSPFYSPPFRGVWQATCCQLLGSGGAGAEFFVEVELVQHDAFQAVADLL